jgi:F-type H+-transporting ATPase subunit b
MSLFTAFLLLISFWASPVIAAEGHGASASQLWLPLINFLIFGYLLKRFALPILRRYLSSRHRDIAAAIDEAAGAQRQAETNAREFRERIARMGEEATRLHLELRGVGETEKAKLLKEAENLAAKLRTDADLLAEQEIKAARQALREEIAGAAREAAAKRLRSHLQEADQKRLVEEFVRELEVPR